MKRICVLAVLMVVAVAAVGGQSQQSGQAQPTAPASVLLKPARVFDGVSAQPHEGWVVLVTGNRIAAAGAAGHRLSI